jgi:mitochondrial fusion and transport protein UGO1
MILPSPSKAKPRTNPIPLIIPRSLLLPTILHATLPTYLSSLFTLTLRPYFPRVAFPHSAHYSLPFLASFIDLGIKLPLETILRRAQITFSRPEQTVVRMGRYGGVISCAWDLLVEERGGMFRGWRVGFWGLMMAWVLKTTDALGRGQDVEF